MCAGRPGKWPSIWKFEGCDYSHITLRVPQMQQSVISESGGGAIQEARSDSTDGQQACATGTILGRVSSGWAFRCSSKLVYEQER